MILQPDFNVAIILIWNYKTLCQLRGALCDYGIEMGYKHEIEQP
jgi:hypothetical protein